MNALRGHGTGALVVPMLVLVAACSPAAITPSPAPAMLDPSTVIQFERWEEDGLFDIAIPEGSVVNTRGATVTFTSEGRVLQGGSLQISVSRVGVGDEPADEELARLPPDGATGQPAPFTLDAEDRPQITSARSFPVPATVHCAERHVVEGLAISDADTFLIRITPDAPARCDAREMPETLLILESFSVREP